MLVFSGRKDIEDSKTTDGYLQIQLLQRMLQNNERTV